MADHEALAEEFVEAIPQGGHSTEDDARTMRQLLQTIPWFKVLVTVAAISLAIGQNWINLPSRTSELEVGQEAAKVRLTNLERDQANDRAQHARERAEDRAMNTRMICLLGVPEAERVRLATISALALEQRCTP